MYRMYRPWAVCNSHRMLLKHENVIFHSIWGFERDVIFLSDCTVINFITLL